ncbi:MAG: ATP-binding protein [Candidatus Competibacteraceae bacterium]|nr:ATP-binding protein [Candidatus Competibacteraceae bacterium]MBK8896991.1 ATP-binding protein [Candidatus Competibacteraceae bacterium]
MRDITGLVGRDNLVEKAAQEVRKGRHVILTGGVGIGKSSVLEAILERLERRRDERAPVDSETDDPITEPNTDRPSKRQRRTQTVIHINDHQPKAQFICIARKLLAAGLLDPLTLELPEQHQDLPPELIEWAKIRRHVNRLSMRDLTAAIIPALHDHHGKVIIAVDDLTSVTPTLVAFWLAVFDAAQVIGCASAKKANLNKLWWKMTEIAIPPLTPEATREIVQAYITKQGMLIESPGLFIGHVVKQSGGNPQAIADMLDDSAKERLVDKHRIREMRHAAGVRYFDFTPVMIVALASVVGARYLAIGTGDTELYIFAGMVAAVIISLRVFLFKGAGKAN